MKELKKNLYLTLSTIMIAFALCISLTLTAYNYLKTKETLITHEQQLLEENIKQLLFALETSDKVIYHFGNDIAKSMYKNSLSLKELYEQTGSFDSWDFDALSEQYNMDIYIINDQNTIEYSNVSYDVGLNFKECCRSFSEVLDKRRESNLFYHDGVDVEQSTGELKKYSYMSTEDNKYMIQLGVYWRDSGFYEEFQFDYVANELINERIKAIRLLNIGAIPLGEAHSAYKLPAENKTAFKAAIEGLEMTELVDEDSKLSYFYVPHISTHDFGYTNKKVIEIVYDKYLLNEQLKKHANAFTLQIGFILLVTIILALLIARKFSTPIFLAFHDSLTKLGNRAYFQEFANDLLLKQKAFSILAFDVDNFKMVNDLYGHATGDEVVKLTASLISSFSQNKGYAFRLGGDEFVAILSLDNEEEVKQIVDDIINKFNKSIAPLYPNQDYPLSLSIGVSFAYKDGQHIDDILKAADDALYTAKREGKGQCRLA